MLLCKNFDNAIRWRTGERLHHLFEQRCDELAAAGRQDHLAIDGEDGALTFAALDARANRLARHLLSKGLKPGCRVGLLVDKSLHAYVSLLAILKIDAAYLPLDQSFPLERIGYIARDAEISAILTVSALAHLLTGLDACPILSADAPAIATGLSDGRLTRQELLASGGGVPPGDKLAYIVYTSGSTGHPKGVAVDHSSICNFVKVAGEVYGYVPEDRVFQGMTLAFDFSVEELWVPLLVGATLVPGRSDATLVGRDLAAHLADKRVTGLCCVPTLLATITVDLPLLRFLLVSGEACPHDLVVRWHKPGRRMLNAYGPTEATVTASWTSLHPDKPVTIGVPLPTYTMMILDGDATGVVADGEIGEIGIAGIGLARGYVNRDDLTAKSFVHDFLDLEGNPSRRIYRTGDLGRINEDGEIEYHGRIDTQVKIRGYRIELTEIESKLLEFPGVAQAVVNVHKSSRNQPELVAYLTRKSHETTLEPKAIVAYLRARLPGYMIPAYIEELDSIPMLPSHKADRKKLPDPVRGRVVSGGAEFVAPRTAAETIVANALAETMGLDQVSVEDNFFTDLGGDSLIMAEFVARLQEAMPGNGIAVADSYLNPTVAQLAPLVNAKRPRLVHEPVPAFTASRLQHAVCGSLQYLYYVVIAFAYSLIGIEAFQWQLDADDLLSLYFRSVVAGAALMLVLVLVPIAAKWLLVGCFRETRIPIWSLAYFRFWVVKQLIQTSPLSLFKGQPIFNWYLRALGARVGANAVVNTRFVPVCTDLISIGENAVLTKDTLVQGYRAENGYILTGRIDIGRDSYVGESSLLEIGVSIGDRGQLAHVSSLQSGQSIPEDGRYHGSPAVPTSGDFIPVPPLKCSGRRRWIFTGIVMTVLVGAVVPAFEELITVAVREQHASSNLDAGTLLQQAPYILASLLGLFGLSLVGGLLATALLPRLLRPLLAEEKVYPLYGFHYAVAMVTTLISNSYFYNIVFGDSSFIVNYLRLIGLRLGIVKQTGSNFGSAQKHDIPHACEIGSGTMVSDGLSLINIRQSHSSFKISCASIPENSFLGNQIVYLAGSRLGPGNLLATKVMLPLDGAIRSNIGLLGSPCFEIPRQVVTERSFDPLAETPQRYRCLAAKNRHNLLTVVFYLVLLWGYSALSLALAYATYHLHDTWGWVAILALAFVSPAVTVLYFLAMERLGPGRLALEPHKCTIHDPYFWRVERYWKMGETPLKIAFKGTPFRPWIYRMLGVSVGRMVFDDGCTITEKGLTSIGDHCCLNEATSIQCHSLEDGLFKSDRVTLGAGCTVAPGAFLNYAVSVGDGAVILADSFVMKGGVIGRGQVWVGNPARPA